MLNFKNISKIYNQGLCTGCGICENVCPSNAISMGIRWDSFMPYIDESRCISEKGCAKCLTCCPGIGIDLYSFSERLFPNMEKDDDLGKYDSLYTGYSADNYIRYHSASGGMVTSFLIYLLDKGLIEGAVVTCFSNFNPLRTQTIVVRNREEIIRASSSKYCPVTFAGIYKQIVSSKGKFIVVGLPCHIHGFRKLAEKSRLFSSKIFGYFGIFCSSTRTTFLSEYLLYKYKVKPYDVKSFAFRDDGNPGYLKIIKKNNSIMKVHYHKYYREVRAFFNLKRCLLCFDQFAELSDVSFGDIHIPEFLCADHGINSIIVRNAEFGRLLKKAHRDGYLSISSIKKDKILLSQKKMIYMKKKRIYSAFFLRKIFFKKVPAFGRSFNGRATVKDTISICVGYLQSFIGKRRRLWFLINSLQSIIAKTKKR